jgi:hypothetical protein
MVFDPAFAMAKSTLLSPLKSAVATAAGFAPLLIVDWARKTVEVGNVIGR